MSNPSVSRKLRDAAASLQTGHPIKSVASYLEADPLREITRRNLPIRPGLVGAIKALREEYADPHVVIRQLEKMAADVEGDETVVMLKRDLQAKLDAAFERGRASVDVIPMKSRASVKPQATADAT